MSAMRIETALEKLMIALEEVFCEWRKSEWGEAELLCIQFHLDEMLSLASGDNSLSLRVCYQLVEFFGKSVLYILHDALLGRLCMTCKFLGAHGDSSIHKKLSSFIHSTFLPLRCSDDHCCFISQIASEAQQHIQQRQSRTDEPHERARNPEDACTTMVGKPTL